MPCSKQQFFIDSFGSTAFMPENDVYDFSELLLD